MKKNNSTLSQALSIYTGDSIPKFILRFTAFAALIYAATVLFFFLIIALQSGFSRAYEEIKGEAFTVMYIGMDIAVVIAVTSLSTYEKDEPGGKFFRSTSEGFAAFTKMRTALTIAVPVSTATSLAFIFIISKATGLNKNIASICLSTGAFLLLAIALANFLNMIGSKTARGLLTTLMLMIIGAGGAMLAFEKDDRLGIIQIIAAVLGIVLLPVSNRAFLAHYRKKRWDC